jgi:hypothetical protein
MMPYSCAVAPVVDVDHSVDWESPAGPADDGVCPRTKSPAFIFGGTGDKHWSGQRCDVLGSVPGDSSALLVRLACGCRVWAPRAALLPA